MYDFLEFWYLAVFLFKVRRCFFFNTLYFWLTVVVSLLMCKASKGIHSPASFSYNGFNVKNFLGETLLNICYDFFCQSDVFCLIKFYKGTVLDDFYNDIWLVFSVFNIQFEMICIMISDWSNLSLIYSLRWFV